jgi:hypothetical protein
MEMRKKEFSQSPDQNELSAIASAMSAFTDIIAPSDLKHLIYYIRSNRKEWSIVLEDIGSRFGNMTTTLTRRDAERAGTGFEKIVNVLEKGGARKGKRSRPKPPTGYDGWAW